MLAAAGILFIYFLKVVSAFALEQKREDSLCPEICKRVCYVIYKGKLLLLCSRDLSICELLMCLCLCNNVESGFGSVIVFDFYSFSVVTTSSRKVHYSLIFWARRCVRKFI